MGQDLEYYPMSEYKPSQLLLCTGLEPRQPIVDFVKNRMKITFEINRKQIKVGDYCEGEDLMRQLDPRVLYFKNDPGRQERVEKRIEKY